MKLLVTQENLNRALNTVARIASSRNSLPILANVMLKTVNNRLEISATNLEIAITETIGAKIDKEGSITIPARLAQDFVGSLPAQPLQITVEDNKTTVVSENYSSVINGMPADEFPVMPSIQKKSAQKIIIPTKDLKTALTQVLFTASSDETRPVLTGVFIHIVKGKLFITATDSYRLAEKQIELSNEEEVSLLLPASSLQEVLRAIHSEEGATEISFDEQQAKITIDDVELVTRRIDGTYPDYKKLLPKKFETVAKVSKTELQSITKVSSLFARESAGGIVLKIDDNKGKISIRSLASQIGENTSEAPADIEGSGEVTLNSRYVLDAISAIEDNEIKIGINSKNEPVVISGVSDKSYLHLIMPVKS
jgi:DNA polymerase-3 subunit beta